MTERLLTLFGFVAIVEVLAGAMVSAQRAPAGGLHVIHLAEMIFLITFAVRRFHLRDRVPRLILTGLLLSFLGALVISLGVSPLFAVPPSAAAHICYITAFVLLIDNHGLERRTPLQWWRELAIWPFLAVGLWFLVVDRSLPWPLLAASLVYAFVVTLTGVVALLLGRRLQRHAWLPAAGGISFVLSGCLFGLFLSEGAERSTSVSQLIWITYVLAQVLIMQAAALPRRQEFG